MKKNRYLQALRGWAFLGIFISHNSLYGLGSWGVSVFFILSGFLMFKRHAYDMSWPNLREAITTAYGRIQKLCPLHIVMLVLAMIAYAISEWSTVFGSIERMLTYAGTLVVNVLLIDDWMPKSSIFWEPNIVTWYLSATLFLYIIFPYVSRIVGRWHGKFGTKIFVLSCIWGGFLEILVAVIAVRFSQTGHWIVYQMPIVRLVDFTIGGVMGLVIDEISDDAKCGRRDAGALFLEVMAVLLNIGVIILYNSINFSFDASSVLFLYSSLILVCVFYLHKGWITVLMTNKISVYIGNLSGYAFLIHVVVINYVHAIMKRILLWNGEDGFWFKVLMAGISLPITIMLSKMYGKWLLEHKQRKAL